MEVNGVKMRAKTDSLEIGNVHNYLEKSRQGMGSRINIKWNRE